MAMAFNQLYDTNKLEHLSYRSGCAWVKIKTHDSESRGQEEAVHDD